MYVAFSSFWEIWINFYNFETECVILNALFT